MNTSQSYPDKIQWEIDLQEKQEKLEPDRVKPLADLLGVNWEVADGQYGKNVESMSEEEKLELLRIKFATDSAKESLIRGMEDIGEAMQKVGDLKENGDQTRLLAGLGGLIEELSGLLGVVDRYHSNAEFRLDQRFAHEMREEKDN